ncbi:MAG: type I-U CRISPR-associated protein Csb2 [bacterium]|nr:type I-U CRISPR-associated protein Csb2 [bacterium]
MNCLTGRFTASTHHDRGLAEWPPHPARLFSALVATWADSDNPDPAERNALEWLEALAPPSIVASRAEPRDVVTHFVPVNDATVVSASSYRKRAHKVDDLQRDLAEVRRADGVAARRRVRTLETGLRDALNVTNLVSGTAKTGIDLLPEDRVRQARLYPSVTPAEPTVTYVWEDVPTPGTGDALDGLLNRVTRLGHSSSLVSCRISAESPTPTHVPSDRGKVLRWVRKGQLEHLESEYRQHQGSRPRTLPFTAVRYRSVRDERRVGVTSSLSADTVGDWLIFEFRPASRRLPSTRAVEIAKALRAAVFKYAEDPLPEGLTGHREDGTPSSSPHVGFLPLPHIGHEHADGRLMGAAIAIPESLDGRARRSVLRAIGMWEETCRDNRLEGYQPLVYLKLGRGGRVAMRRQTGTSDLVALRPSVWRRPARRWVSATPVALPTHPGPLARGTATARAKAWIRAEEAVIASCRHIGLPEPVRVVVSFDPFIRGARPAQRFPAFHQGDHRGGVARRQVHVSVTFAEPVGGPLVLGAGRYLGLGLMRPFDTEKRG